ncbi:MAG: strictosidine synthase [Pseudomonadota bacterium]
MFDALRHFSDRLLGRGSAAITVPVMDGALKPNRALDEAQLVAQLPDIDDLATDGQSLFVTAGALLYRLDGAQLVELRRFDGEITALAAYPGGPLAVAVAGRSIVVGSVHGGTWTERASLRTSGAAPLHGVNALHFETADALLYTEGSAHHAPADWCRDLMEKGRTGRVSRWRIGGVGSTGGDATELLAQGLHHALGVLSLEGQVLYSESWRHRVGRVANAAPMLADLPGYPSRMASSQTGGFWLTCFACRTQLVEFVLREDAYRTRMLATVDPRYWVAPALRSGTSYLEPLQGAGVKQMGVLKPWAPPRSYGLVVHVDARGRITQSLHSQVDGQHHGITAVAEIGDALFVASKGSGRLLRIALPQAGGAT